MKRLTLPLALLLLPFAARAHEGDHGTSGPAHMLQSPDHAVILLAVTVPVAVLLRWLVRR